MLRITEIYRSTGISASLYIVFNNKYRIEVRLFNVGTAEVQFEDLERNGSEIMQVFEAPFVKVESDMLGKEYDLPDNFYKLRNMIYSCVYPDYSKIENKSLGEIIALYDKGELDLFEIDEYETPKYNGVEELFKKHHDGIKRFTNDAFKLGYNIVNDVIKERKGK